MPETPRIVIDATKARDAIRIDGLLTQISNQYDAVSATLCQERGFAEDIARDPEIFAAACQEATK